MKCCPVCKTEFEARKISDKYCSVECRLENVREKDKLRKRQERKHERIIRDREKGHAQQVKKETREKDNQEKNEARQSELMEKVNAGDPLARMQVAKPQSVEYWEAYKQYAIDYAKGWNRESRKIVNSISVNEPKFAEKVVAAIKESGYIKTGVY